jgi:hypothetical protein
MFRVFSYSAAQSRHAPFDQAHQRKHDTARGRQSANQGDQEVKNGWCPCSPPITGCSPEKIESQTSTYGSGSSTCLWVLFTRPSQNEACLRWESKISLGRRGDLAAETGQAAIGQQGMEVSGPLPDTAHLNDFYRVLAVPADSRTCVPWPRVHGTCASVLSFEHDRIG